MHELVRLHGGAITVDSQMGKGTAFYVSIPFGFSHLPQEHIGAQRSSKDSGILGTAFALEASGWISGQSQDAAGGYGTIPSVGAARLQALF